MFTCSVTTSNLDNRVTDSIALPVFDPLFVLFQLEAADLLACLFQIAPLAAPILCRPDRPTTATFHGTTHRGKETMASLQPHLRGRRLGRLRDWANGTGSRLGARRDFRRSYVGTRTHFFRGWTPRERSPSIGNR